MPKTLLRLALLPLVCALGSCSLLDQGMDLPPGVMASQLQLRKSPGLKTLAAWYCPTLVGGLACGLVLGPPPPESELIFEFGITITIHNPNNVPVPALDVLLALTLFAGQDAQGLGATCIHLCGQADTTCTGQAPPGACDPAQAGVPSLNDFANRIPGLVADVVSGEAQQELRKSTIAAAGDVTLDLAFPLGIDQALGVIKKTATTFLMALLNGQNATLTVPVSAQGTVFFQLPLLGRYGVAYGPIQSSWQIL